MLPKAVQRKMPDLNFPTRWQAVIFRNYGVVSTAKLAEVLSCDEQTVLSEALRLGLTQTRSDEKWIQSGYITIIRNNWFLLPYSQLTKLLSFSKERLAFCLKEEDFLMAKLGDKPLCDEVRYTPLTAEQIIATEKLAKTVCEVYCPTKYKPFDFFSVNQDKRKFDFGESKSTKIVHGYLTPCGDALMENSESYLPDSLLEEYQRQGINGLWMHGVLSALSPYPFREELSKDYQTRRSELKRLIKRAARFGIKIYLYFNEPRYLPVEGFGKYERLIGHREKGDIGEIASVCLSEQQTQDYLYNAFKDFASDIKDLGGIITITMSEYLTHCHSHQKCNCPRCKDISTAVSAARVNNIIMRAVKDSGTNIEVLANLWGWSRLYGWTDEEIAEGIDLLDKDISVVCVSEYGSELNKGGVKVGLIDYSIPNFGPSPEAQRNLERAKKNGHKIYAKIQTSNSWECSCVPYLPVFDLVYRHLEKLSAIGVNDYMLCWTLGGYPSPCLNLAAAKGQGKTLDEWYASYYGADAARVKQAVKLMCEGFESYPFTVYSLYYSPCSLGPANLWSLSPDEKTSMMVGFAYDDYETWITPYPVDIYLALYETLLDKWNEGLSVLKNGKKTPLVEELCVNSEAAYLHFKSAVNHTKYAVYKRDILKNKEALLALFADERETAARLMPLVAKDSRVGFEASNHYFYTQNNLIEKILNLDILSQKLKGL